MPQEKTRSEYARAMERLNRYLALRDHSRFELKQKLLKSFDPELVEHVVAEASDAGWLASEEEIAARAALTYARQNKSRSYIEAQLRKRHLPLPPLSAEEELDKIRALVERRFGLIRDLSFEERQRVFRFLKYRGFEDRSIRQVMHDEE
jgi:regulatory protein